MGKTCMPNHPHSLAQLVLGWFYKNRWLLLLAFLLGAVAHYQIWSNLLQNPDSIWIGQVYQADHWAWLPHWETMQGRWGLWAVDAARGGMNVAALTALPMLTLYTVAAVLIADLFAIQGIFARLLAVLLVVCAPSVAAVETYRYCSASYALSFLLAVLAVCCVAFAFAEKYPRCGVAVGTLCLMLSLSLYQPGLQLAAGLSLLVLLRQILHQRRDASLLRRLLVMGVSGTVLYFAVYKLLLAVGGLQAAGYGGADVFSLANILQNLRQGIPQAYLDFARYYGGHNIAANGFGGRVVAVLLFAVGGTAVLRLLWQQHSPAAAVQAVVCAALLPLAVNLMGLLLPGNSLLLRTAGGMLPVLPFLLSVVQAAWPQGRRAAVRRSAVWVLALLMVRGYALQINADALTMLAYKNQYVTVLRQIEAELTAMPEYRTADSIAVLGRLPSENCPLEPLLKDMADPFAQDTIFWGMAASDRAAWINGFYEELGWQPTFCDEARCIEIAASDTFGAMPCYPETGSVRVVDGVLVVKVSS